MSLVLIAALQGLWFLWSLYRGLGGAGEAWPWRMWTLAGSGNEEAREMW